MSTIETNGFRNRVARALKLERIAILIIFSYSHTPAGRSKVRKVEFFDAFNMSFFRLFMKVEVHKPEKSTLTPRILLPSAAITKLDRICA